MKAAHQPVATPAPIARPMIEAVAGYPSVLDTLAEEGAPGARFLRAAWYAASDGDATTVVARRDDGTPLFALPMLPTGPTALGVRTVPGSYWPFRSVVLGADVTRAELTAVFADPKARALLGNAWRLGPVYGDDAALMRLIPAARAAGWTLLRRAMGSGFALDHMALSGRDWRPNKRLIGYQRRLADALGPVTLRTIRGTAWDDDALAMLGAIEAVSWVGTSTDGSGAKFMTVDQRARWSRVLADPVLADRLSATVLIAGETPVAFTFDLRDGEVQYAIASGYDDRHAGFRPGHIVTAYQFSAAIADGVRHIDLGIGDSGYKQAMGAVRCAELFDCLFVENSAVAALARRRWEGSRVPHRDIAIDPDEAMPSAPASGKERWLAIALALSTLALVD